MSKIRKMISCFLEFFPNNHVKIANICSSIQNIALTFGLLIGAGWAVYNFKSLDQATLANLNVAKAKYDLALTETQSQNLDDNITVSQFPDNINQSKKILLINVHLKNAGTQDIVLDTFNYPLQISHVVLRGNQRLSASETFQIWTYKKIYMAGDKSKCSGDLTGFMGCGTPRRRISLDPSENVDISYLAEVKSSAWYLITFSSPVEPLRETEAVTDLTKPHLSSLAKEKSGFYFEKAPVSWVVTSFVYVPK